MAKSPFYKIIFEEDDYDISNIVSSFTFEDCVDEDNLLILQINKANLELIDNISSRKGKTIKFQYGFLGGNKTPFRLAEVKNIPVKYSGSIGITIKAHDHGYAIKKHRSNRIFEDKTSSKIIKIIANEFSFKTNIEDTDKKHTIPQGNKTYFEFIKRLAIKEGFIFFVKDDTIIFKKRDLSEKSIKLYEYNNGNGIVKSFFPEYEDSGSSNKVSSNGIDSDTGDIFNLSSEPEETNETGLGKKLLKFDIFGKLLGETSESGGINIPPETNENEIKKQTDKQTDDSVLNNMKAKLDIELDTSVNVEDIITVNGVAKEHSGNWYITKKTDKLGSGSSSTSLDIKKNATNNKDGGNGDPKDINSTIGDPNASTEKDIEIRVFDVNGNRIS